MVLNEVNDFLVNLCPKKYYEITDELFFNPLVKLVEINDEKMLYLLNCNFEIDEIVSTINKWLIAGDKTRKEGLFGLFSKDLQLVGKNTDIVRYFNENYSPIINIIYFPHCFL